MPASTPATTSDIDVIDPGVYERGGIPHEQFRRLRDHDPVHWHRDLYPDVPGFWAVTRHADVIEVSRNPQLYSSHVRTSMYEEFTDDEIALYGMTMLFQDPPDHTRNRAKVNRGFTPRMIKKLEGHVRDICNELIDDVAERGNACFVADIAAPLPAYVICELIGAPVTDRDLICDWSNRIIGFADPELNGAQEAAARFAGELMAYAARLAEERTADPRDDIATALLQPDENGDRLSGEEFQLFLLMLVIAGHETTRNGSAGGMQAFFDHPDQWERLRADRSLLRTAPDEIVRWTSPINLFRRTARADTVLGGREIRKGDKVVLFYGSANRDERAIDDPFTFDVGRDPNPHLGFGGGGPHFCLGTHLARLELAVLFDTLLDRLPDIRPAGPARRLRSNFVNGVKELRVEFTPSARHGT
ncbi:cytochrome P450 [Actinomadura flavalba]|uniref:cytochrome P450 n=1 Tax=Actinomadura flavalba TaxID=1120938 RepID=UPI0004782A89|nr:cytochrome P450 [Actinomadura flavalba]